MAAQSEDTPISFESGHTDLIHDVAVDFYGKTLASASSDRCIRLFEINGDQHQFLTKLTGHTGPVWKVAWAHPTFGRILASCSYDKSVIIWRPSSQQSPQKWQKWFVDDSFASSVNTVQFYPAANNGNALELMAGCADGSIRIYALQNKSWSQVNRIDEAHIGGVNAISWATPSRLVMAAADAQNGGAPAKRFVSGGCDNMVKVWRLEPEANEYRVVAELKQHEDWVRDVAWSPIPCSASHAVIASCSEDKTVLIWKGHNGKFAASEKIELPAKVWSVSWSELGNILAVTFGENTVQLYKEGNKGKWQNVTKVN